MNLKQLHPYLNARVRLKGTVNILLGLSLLLSDHLPGGLSTSTAQSSLLGEFISFDVWGSIFLILGLGIMYGIHRGREGFPLTRWFLRMSLLYSFFWFVVLILTVITGETRTSAVMILWGYWVWNQWLVSTDPGWGALPIIKKAIENGR